MHVCVRIHAGGFNPWLASPLLGPLYGAPPAHLLRPAESGRSIVHCTMSCTSYVRLVMLRDGRRWLTTVELRRGSGYTAAQVASVLAKLRKRKLVQARPIVDGGAGRVRAYPGGRPPLEYRWV